MKISNTFIVASTVSLMSILSSVPAKAVTFYQSTVNVAPTNGGIPTLTGSPANTKSSFTAAANSLGSVSVIDFEGLTSANFTQSPANTYSATIDGVVLVVRNSPFEATSTTVANNGISRFSGTTQAYGFDTTVGGDTLLRLNPGTTPTTQTTVTFNFADPVEGFGLYINDYGNTTNGVLTATATTVNNTSLAPRVIPRAQVNSSTSRRVLFYGFTNAASDPSISSVRFTWSGVTGIDRLGFDDVLYVNESVSVPEAQPFSILGVLSILGLGASLKAKLGQKKS